MSNRPFAEPCSAIAMRSYCNSHVFGSCESAALMVSSSFPKSLPALHQGILSLPCSLTVSDCLISTCSCCSQLQLSSSSDLLRTLLTPRHLLCHGEDFLSCPRIPSSSRVRKSETEVRSKQCCSLCKTDMAGNRKKTSQIITSSVIMLCALFSAVSDFIMSLWLNICQ